MEMPIYFFAPPHSLINSLSLTHTHTHTHKHSSLPLLPQVITQSMVDGQFVGGMGSSMPHDGPPDSSLSNNYDSLAHEIQILCRLSHPNVVHCFGGCLR
jgi:hypothetical protein